MEIESSRALAQRIGLAVVGIGLILFAIVFAQEASGSAGVVALAIATVGLALVIAS